MFAKTPFKVNGVFVYLTNLLRAYNIIVVMKGEKTDELG